METPFGLVVGVAGVRVFGGRVPTQICLGGGFEGGQVRVGAEVVGLTAELLGDGLGAVDLHAAHRVARAAAGGEPEQPGEDESAKDVERELVVDVNGAEDVCPGWARA